jgi:YidC/Oxa1 family membrane protein insertase
MIPLAAVLHAASTTTTTVAGSHHASGSILDPIARPLAWVLAGVYAVIPNYGVAIIGLSILWMLIISPLTLKSTRSMLAMQKLQPELKKLQEKHKNDRQAFAQAQMDLFREHNVSPFGSCLPMLLPLPVFFALFKVIDGLSHTVTQNGVVVADPKYLNSGTQMFKAISAAHGHLEAFGMDLSKSALAHHSGVIAAAPYWIALLIMAGTSYLQSSMMMSRNQVQAAANPQMRMMKYLAPLFALFCIRFPAGVVVYYATSNICRILQQDAMYRFDPKVKALVAQEVVEVEEITKEIDDRQKNRPGYTPPRGARPASPDKDAPAGKGGRAGGSGSGSSAGSGGRSRFRDLLAAAAEQQRIQQEAKSGNGSGRSETKQGNPNGSDGRGSGSSGGGSSGGGTSGSTGSKGGSAPKSGGGGQARTGGTSGGQAGAGGSGGQNRNRPSTSRTNRKRRGR